MGMVEDIVLESPEQAAEHLTPKSRDIRQVQLEYTLQPKHSKFEFHFRLFDDCFLEMEKSCPSTKEKQATAFHIGLLESKPKRERSFAWVTCLGGLLTGFAAVVMAVWLNDPWLATGTGILSVMLFAGHYYSYRKVSVFYSRAGKIPLIALNHRCRCEKSLQQFVTQLEQSIQQHTLPASSNYFAEETKWHRLLREHEWISDDDYKKARSRIMKQFNRHTS